MARIVLVQDFLTNYRRPVFEALQDELERRGHRFLVTSGRYQHSQPTQTIDPAIAAQDLGGLNHIALDVRKLGPLKLYQLGNLLEPIDVVLVPAELSSCSWWIAALHRIRRSQLRPLQILMVGHGRNFNRSHAGLMSDLAYSMIAHVADGYLGYTESSRQTLLQLGFPEERCLSFGQSKAILALRKKVKTIRQGDLKSLRSQLGLGSGPIACFVGRLMPRKNLRLLVEAFDLVLGKKPDAQLLILGEGPERDGLVEQAQSRPWLHCPGAAWGTELSQYLAVSDFQVSAGGVGLSILDGFAAEHPLITVMHPDHAPDVDYLRPGYNGLLCEASAGKLADTVLSLLNRPETLLKMQKAAAASLEGHGLKPLANRLADGIERLSELGCRSSASRGRGLAKGLWNTLTQPPKLTLAHPQRSEN
ncbi:MAG: hypothetical protein CMH50_14750 [Myxococcales bacterium]|nr:hypothetical protein [Myxococcales bacterium]